MRDIVNLIGKKYKKFSFFMIWLYFVIGWVYVMFLKKFCVEKFFVLC